MLPADISGMQFLSPQSPITVPTNFPMTQTDFPNFQFMTSFLPSSQIPPICPELTAPSSSLSTNSTSDESEEQQRRIIDERKRRRMISNRESARRSRMRKQRHLDELWSHVVRLRNENHNLIDKLSHVSQCHDSVLQENAKLLEEVSDLRRLVGDLQIHVPFNKALRELQGTPSSDQSVTQSIDVLH